MRLHPQLRIYRACALIGCALLLTLGEPPPALADIGGIGATPPKPTRAQMRKRRAMKKAQEEAKPAEEGAGEENAAPPAENAGAKKTQAAKGPNGDEGPVVIDNGQAATKPKTAEMPDASATTKAAPVAAPAEPTPLLVISFASKHVYYDRQLEKIIKAAERDSAGANYRVVSLVPASTASKTKNERLADDYNANLNGVVQKFEELGVQPYHVSVSSEASPAVTAQTINIYKQ